MPSRSVLSFALTVTVLLSPLVGSRAVAQAPLRFDDGFTTYDLIDYESRVDGVPTWEGYQISANLRVWGSAGRHSIFHLVFLDGTTQVGEVRCQASTQAGTPDYHYETRCTDASQRLRVVGDLTVRISLIDGATDVETALATHTVSVREAARVVPGGEGGPAPSSHYIGYHHGLLEGVMWRSGPGVDHVYYPGVRSSYSRPSWMLTFGAVGPSSYNALLRCRVDGVPFEIHDSQWGRTDEVQVYGNTWSSRAVGSRYTTGTSGATTDEEMMFRRYNVELPLSFGDGAVTVANRPGNWTCELRNTGRVFRTFRFVVGADGVVVPHEEQTAGNLYLGPPGVAVLVEIDVPADGGGFDLRTSPPETTRGFWGRAWTSASMRALAAAVPAIGIPYLPAPPRQAPAAAARGQGRRRR